MKRQPSVFHRLYFVDMLPLIMITLKQNGIGQTLSDVTAIEIPYNQRDIMADEGIECDHVIDFTIDYSFPKYQLFVSQGVNSQNCLFFRCELVFGDKKYPPVFLAEDTFQLLRRCYEV